MAKGKAEMIIERSADEVWARIGDFSDPSWIPSVTWFEMDGDLRTTREGDHEAKQRLVHHDDEARTLSYELASEIRLPNGELAQVAATISVAALGPDSSRVTWAYDTGSGAGPDTIGSFYTGILTSVKDELEAR